MGAQIEWEPRTPARHVECAAPAVVAPAVVSAVKPPAPGRPQIRVTVRVQSAERLECLKRRDELESALLALPLQDREWLRTVRGEIRDDFEAVFFDLPATEEQVIVADDDKTANAMMLAALNLACPVSGKTPLTARFVRVAAPAPTWKWRPRFATKRGKVAA